VGELSSHRQIMGDQQDAVARSGKSAENGEDLLLHREVERSRRLVGDEKARAAGERPDRNACPWRG